MKVLQFAVAGIVLAALSASAVAQQGMYGDAAGAPYAGGQPGYMQAQAPQMGPMQGMPGQMGYGAAPGMYPGMQAGYQMDPGAAQAALYGPPTPVNGDPMPMYGGPGDGCGPGCGAPNMAECFDDQMTHYAYGSAEIFYARRNASTIKQPVVIDSGTLGTLMTTGDLHFDYMPGVKGQAGYMFSNGIGIESDFWGQWSFTSRKTVNGDNNLSLPGDLALSSFAFFDADRIDQVYSSHINNYEINIIMPYASFQWLAGFRYLTVDERYDINSLDLDTGPGDYTILTRNRLYGGQVGARTQWQVERFVFDFEAKAGVFANAAHQDQRVVDSDGAVLRDANGSEHQAAFVGEVSSYLFIPMGSHFTGRLGYTAIWVDELALAPNQLDFTDTATSGTGIYARRGILIHGFNAGMEFRW